MRYEDAQAQTQLQMNSYAGEQVDNKKRAFSEMSDSEDNGTPEQPATKKQRKKASAEGTIAALAAMSLK